MFVAITTNIPTPRGFVWWPAEVEHQTIEAVHEALKRDGSIIIQRLEGDRLSDGTYLERNRTQAIVSASMVGTIFPLHLRVFPSPHRAATADRA